jgi:hypothetical protein
MPQFFFVLAIFKHPVYTIRDQSAIFQLAILSLLAGAREYNHVLLAEKSGTFIAYSVIYYFPVDCLVFKLLYTQHDDLKTVLLVLLHFKKWFRIICEISLNTAGCMFQNGRYISKRSCKIFSCFIQCHSRALQILQNTGSVNFRRGGLSKVYKTSTGSICEIDRQFDIQCDSN